jgi:hypothetical protein
LPKGCDYTKIQIGIPVTNNEANNIGLQNMGDTILPSGSYGKTCNQNAYGYSYPDRSKPKINRCVSTNWIQPYGNEYASSIPVDIYRDCYSLIDVPPMEIELVLFGDKDGHKFIIADLTPDIRNKYLKEAINIFLEIFGLCYIFSDEIRIENMIKRQHCNWVILPPGEKPSVHITNHLRIQGRNDDTFDVFRLESIEKYKYEKIVEGVNGFYGYFAYVFENYCVFESAIYGNATYILPKQNWEIMSQKTKKELTDIRIVVSKIIHTEKWVNILHETFKRLGII